MGYRTVVSLNNDHPWYQDPDLAAKIYDMQNMRNCKSYAGINLVECTHSSTVSLLQISYYGLTRNMGSTDYDNENIDLFLLKQMASKLGYRVVKKSK